MRKKETGDDRWKRVDKPNVGKENGKVKRYQIEGKW